MRPVRLLPGAERDLVRLEDFLLSKSERAGRAAGAAIRRALIDLSQFPYQGPETRRGGIRQLIIKFGRDGYVAQYRVAETELVVARIFHGRERR